MKKPDFDVHHLAELARIELTSDEEAHFGHQLSQVLGYVDQLAKLDVTTVPETAQVTGLTDIFQTPAESLDQAELEKRRDNYLSGAPEHEQGYIKIPAIFAEE